MAGSAFKPYLTPSTKLNNPGPSSVPSAIKSKAKFKSPVSKISNSGSTPASRITLAILRTLRGVLITMSEAPFIVLKSKEQMSGFSLAICSTRFSGWHRVVPGANTFGSSSLGINRPPGPVVRLIMSSLFCVRINSTTFAYKSKSID